MLPKDYITVRFPQTQDDESYQLLELPAEILAQVEGGAVVPYVHPVSSLHILTPTPSLTIKGRPADDSVLCTSDKTYTLRSVTISNSLVVLRAPEPRTLAIRDICHEVLECVPAAGRVERVGVVLRESAWRGLGSDEPNGGRKRKRDAGKRYTRAQLESIVQASDAELAAALREQNVVEVDGHMLLLPPAHLAPLLSILLGIATAYGVLSKEGDVPGVSMRLEAAVDALAEHDVAEGLSRGVLSLFGQIDDAHWTCDVSAAVRELGRGLLVGLGVSTDVRRR